jgi:hypothetical protein
MLWRCSSRAALDNWLDGDCEHEHQNNTSCHERARGAGQHDEAAQRISECGGLVLLLDR